MTTLAEDRIAIVEAVRDFATTALAPHAARWDAEKHFPVDTLREAGELGLGGIYVREDVGGSGLMRRDAVAIFEELAKGDTTIAAYISIHNMVAWMIDTYGDDEQRAQVGAGAGVDGGARQLLSHRARDRLGCGRDHHQRHTRWRRVRHQRGQAVHLGRRLIGDIRRHGTYRRAWPEGHQRDRRPRRHPGPQLRPERSRRWDGTRSRRAR